MIEISLNVLTIGGFVIILIALMTGFPVAWVLGGVSIITGLLFWGPQCLDAFYQQMYGYASMYVFLAVPLFIFMGGMIQESGVGKRLFDTMYVIFGGFNGGIGVATVVVGALLATCLGIIGASVVMLTLVALPNLLSHGYDKSLSSATVCASGSLGIFIPPSVLLVIYGPLAGISVGKLFMGAFLPGFMLAGTYCVYIAIRGFLNPRLAPAITPEEQVFPLRVKIQMFVTSAMPLIVLIFSVLGVIYMGIAPPTEAAAMGAAASIIIAAAYRRLRYKPLRNACQQALKATVMIIYVMIAAAMFQSVFMKLGGSDYFSGLVLSAPGGRWGSFVVIMAIIFILGFFIVDFAIVLIMVPLITPIAAELGFDPVWFAMMVCLIIQTSYLTPPFAPAIFYLKGAADPSLGITTQHVIKGIIPFVFLVMLAMGLCVAFPQIVTWLPSTMIK